MSQINPPSHCSHKLTLVPVGIVFAPTLNIPAPLISLFLSDFDSIFGVEVDEASSPIREITVTAPLTPEAIRSPRRQMFSDLPTPSYTQTSFQSPKPFANNPGYNSPRYQQPPPHLRNGGHEGYNSPQFAHDGSLNGALYHGPGADLKAKRRESSMLMMNMGLGALTNQRKGSLPRIRDN